MKLSPLFHPFLFLLASIFFLYSQTSVIAAPVQIIRPLLVLTVLLVILIRPAFQIARDLRWTGILLTIFVLGICSNEEFSLIVVCTLVIAVLFGVLRKHGIKADHVTNLMNLAGLLFVIYYGYSLFVYLPNLPKSYYSDVDQADYYPRLSSSRDVVLPDIYYIVLDGYGRADILKEIYQFDNSQFLHFLENKGFIIPSESRSNYPKTALSVTSTLNMEYIDALTPGLNGNINWWLMSPLIDRSRSRIALEQIGYQSISIATDWSITDNPTSDIYYRPVPIILNDFEGFLLNHTPLVVMKSFLSDFAVVPSYSSHRNLIKYNFVALSKISDIPGPKFTFAHIIAPHPPFVFDSEGNPLEPNYRFTFNDASDFSLSNEQYRQGYIGQLKFVNHQLEQVIESIIDNSESPPIIILQADHGPGMLVDFASVKNTCLRERFSTFAAYYLPGADPKIIPNDITAVNLFRIIFNEYFGAKLPLLDRFHYYYNSVFIYDGEDVTQRVDSCTLP